jgi:hypothetical protein
MEPKSFYGLETEAYVSSFLFQYGWIEASIFIWSFDALIIDNICACYQELSKHKNNIL